ncbi:MAG: ATP-binding cassette domain-containing protein [Syntrophaceae bacterium]|nr:ATP-binding cassette domain-containing protein [Syntrophaceae bacterium]
MSWLYDLRNIRKTRKSGNVVFELHIPEFQVRFGEFVAVLGPSGCGKSTLLDLLALVLRPDETGKAVFRFAPSLAPSDEADISSCWRSRKEKEIAAIRRRHIGYVLQTGGLLPFLSVGSNIALTCRLNGISNIENRVNTIAERLGIREQLSKKPQFLSGGQRQRVAIARAMVHQPAVVLADEPTAAVDRERAKVIVEQFNQLAKEKKIGIVMVTHDQKLVEMAADRKMTFKMDHGSENGMEKTISTMFEGFEE